MLKCSYILNLKERKILPVGIGSRPVAVVTGASRGLGKEIALTLGRSGYNVAINYLASGDDAKKTAEEIGENAFLVKADVGDIKQVERMADAVYKKWGRVDALVNNAGITKDKLLLKTSEEDWDEVLRVNLTGCFNTIKAFSHIMIKSKGGHIINISSYSGVKGKEGQAAYSASKAALLGLTYTAAEELAEYNIRVNALLPGYMQTEMGVAAKKAMDKAKAESISGSLSRPKEVAEFVAYILRTDNITGQVFSLDSRII
ncbi:MAG: SDR family NAD(P)-dependent oxidoreductase [Nitrospirae bacterium]|nr:MAG: SDR family NAD(P)-dependent oxidoreductase [Nitrospirota bacterium]